MGVFYWIFNENVYPFFLENVLTDKMSAVNNHKSQLNMGKRFGTRKKKKRNLASTDPEKSCHHYKSSFDKQILFRDIIKHFADWPTWQKRLLLCRFTEKTSPNLLSTLSTVLEPIFHRDFEVKSQDGFHSTLIKTFLDRKIRSTFLTTTSLSVNPSFTVSPSHHSPSSTTNVVNDLTDIRNATSQQDNSKESDHPVPISLYGNSNQKCIGSRSEEKSLNSVSPAHSHHTIASASIIGKKSSMYTQGLRRTSLKSLDKNFRMPNIDSTLSSVQLHRGISHSHIIHRNSGSLSTMEFLQCSQKQNLGKLGELVKPSVNKYDTTRVKQYKHKKWWLPPIHTGQTLQRASKKNLLRSFKRITDEFVQKYTLWSNAEKGDFMLNIIDYCLPDEIIFLANCIYQRLQKLNDINNVSDSVLLNIFSYLEIDDLIEAGQVCQRWKFLTSSGHIWKEKCYNLAYENGQLDVMKNLEMSSVELEWKQLYYELEDSISLLKSYENHNIAVSNENISEHSFEVIDDNESHHTEDIVESRNYGENSITRSPVIQTTSIHTDDFSGSNVSFYLFEWQ